VVSLEVDLILFQRNIFSDYYSTTEKTQKKKKKEQKIPRQRKALKTD